MEAAILAPEFTNPDKAREVLEAERWPDGPVCPQFTVTVGTIFEDSHLPLNKWLLAIHLLCASKNGMSAHQLHRMLGIGYRSAWFMAHRIRYGMRQKIAKARRKAAKSTSRP